MFNIKSLRMQKKYAVKAVDTTSYITSYVQLKQGVRKDSPRRGVNFDKVYAKELATAFSKTEAKEFARELNLSQEAALVPSFRYEISRI